MKQAERQVMLHQKLVAMQQYEKVLQEQGATYIAGVDEVGRGPLAGPVVAAAVILPSECGILGIDDSKKLSAKKRESLDALIRKEALAYGFGRCDVHVIDEINILEATKLAMKEAVLNAEAMLGQEADHVLLDALTLKDLPRPQTGIVGGDGVSVSIAAASIIAKVARDAMMTEYSREYPHYCFEKNKGYGTKDHVEGIKAHGPCPIHRRTFLRNIL